ncbi:unnamed protein product, partial [Rotaria magnacalcarata]
MENGEFHRVHILRIDGH